ncbi:hypothetical protein JG688_00013457 [Phytophthora aleatoria]|uniref:Uncharacterized protein n=1 Tax=Phytophthora aleatoria TaxID=2496075 RepID=A0A8J5LYI9_9STRA|nr:hypothetical protein JG688_00013457 [Phytophthora aleatoria]
MLAQVTKADDDSWRILIKREVYLHSHQHYLGIRQVSTQSPLVPGVQLLMKARAGTSSIYEYIWENSDHRATVADVRNWMARLRSSGIC